MRQQREPVGSSSTKYYSPEHKNKRATTRPDRYIVPSKQAREAKRGAFSQGRSKDQQIDVNIQYMIAYLPYIAQQNLTSIIGGATLITRVTAMLVLEIEYNEDSYQCFVHLAILFDRLIMDHARNATRVLH
jgi:hypothetical protein